MQVNYKIRALQKEKLQGIKKSKARCLISKPK